MADVGGYLGLLLGISLISIFEEIVKFSRIFLKKIKSLKNLETNNTLNKIFSLVRNTFKIIHLEKAQVAGRKSTNHRYLLGCLEF